MSHRLSSDSPPSLMKAGTPVLISERGHSFAAPGAFDRTGRLFLARRAVLERGRKSRAGWWRGKGKKGRQRILTNSKFKCQRLVRRSLKNKTVSVSNN